MNAIAERSFANWASISKRARPKHRRRDYDRVVLPPSNFLHEHGKVEKRRPAAVDFIKRSRPNEFLGRATGDVGLIVQGSIYNALNRAMVLPGLADE
ncbi:MAG: hypothetical protein P8Y58_17035 [Novosphingobium sp.]